MHKKKVLYFDDNPENLDTVRLFFDYQDHLKENYVLVTVLDSINWQAVVEDEQPDILILDIDMSIGGEVIAESLGKEHYILIAHTAASKLTVSASDYEALFNGIITKPTKDTTFIPAFRAIVEQGTRGIFQTSD